MTGLTACPPAPPAPQACRAPPVGVFSSSSFISAASASQCVSGASIHHSYSLHTNNRVVSWTRGTTTASNSCRNLECKIRRAALPSANSQYVSHAAPQSQVPLGTPEIVTPHTQSSSATIFRTTQKQKFLPCRKIPPELVCPLPLMWAPQLAVASGSVWSDNGSVAQDNTTNTKFPAPARTATLCISARSPSCVELIRWHEALVFLTDNRYQRLSSWRRCDPPGLE